MAKENPMAKQNLTLEDVITIVDKVAGRSSQTQTAVPTVQVQKPDSFESLTSGAMKGWPFIMFVLVIGYTVVTNFNTITSTNENQDQRIQQNAEAIRSIEGKLDDATTASNEIIRRLDNLQKDLELLKSK